MCVFSRNIFIRLDAVYSTCRMYVCKVDVPVWTWKWAHFTRSSRLRSASKKNCCYCLSLKLIPISFEITADFSIDLALFKIGDKNDTFLNINNNHLPMYERILFKKTS